MANMTSQEQVIESEAATYESSSLDLVSSWSDSLTLPLR